MAHTAPPSSSRRGLELAFGFVLLLVGAVVAVVAVVALHHPSAQQAASASEPKRTTGSSPSGSPAPRTTAPSSGSKAAPGSTSSGNAAAGNPAPATSAPPTPSTAGSGKLPLIVLNNTSSTPGSVAADRFSQAGWTVTDVSTFDGAILSTAAYYDPNVDGAETAATELQREFPAIQRVKPKFDGLPQGPIVVVLTSDYS